MFVVNFGVPSLILHIYVAYFIRMECVLLPQERVGATVDYCFLLYESLKLYGCEFHAFHC